MLNANLSNIAKIEKNKLISDTIWIILLEIALKSGYIMRFCSDNEDVVWDGETWIAFPFDLESPKQTSSGELPRFAIRVSNITRAIEGYLEQEGGGVGATVRMMVVMSTHSDITEPECDMEFTVQSTS